MNEKEILLRWTDYRKKTVQKSKKISRARLQGGGDLRKKIMNERAGCGKHFHPVKNKGNKNLALVV
jgi:hypothetical protein